jgi:translation elongation factor EF-Ts
MHDAGRNTPLFSQAPSCGNHHSKEMEMLRKKGTYAAGKRAQRRAAAEDAAAVKAVLDAKAAREAEVDENEAGRGD